jgi:hypothetical protein
MAVEMTIEIERYAARAPLQPPLSRIGVPDRRGDFLPLPTSFRLVCWTRTRILIDFGSTVR